MSQFTVSSNWVNLITTTAKQRGVEKSKLPTLHADSSARFDLEDVIALWRQCVDLTGDQDFGLHVGENLTPAQLNILGHIILSSRTPLDGIISGQRYMRLISDGGKIDLDITSEKVRVTFQTASPAHPFSRHQIEAAITSIFACLKWTLGANAKPSAIYFKHDEPDSIKEHQRIFNCPIYFSQPVNAIEGELNHLNVEINPDQTLIAFHEEMATKMLTALDEETWTDRVTQLLESRMSQQQYNDNTLSKEHIAAQFGVTPKTLQRRLADESTQFSSLLDDTRERMALHYLAQPELSMEDITLLLGFSEPSAFSRAFKRWTGKPPGDYR